MSIRRKIISFFTALPMIFVQSYALMCLGGEDVFLLQSISFFAINLVFISMAIHYLKGEEIKHLKHLLDKIEKELYYSKRNSHRKDEENKKLEYRIKILEKELLKNLKP